jgi:hypothetical protein
MVSAVMPPIYDASVRRQAPWRQRGEIGDHMIIDAGEHVSEPGLRVDVVPTDASYQTVDHVVPDAAPVFDGAQ